MEYLDFLVELHGNAERQGPGGDEQTRRAVELSGLANKQGLRIADIGCGTGASVLTLAKMLDAEITAVDFLPAFLTELNLRAASNGVSDRITTVEASMDKLEFEPSSFDAIWSEGAIYNIGFEAGVRDWRQYLKPNGVLAVSELTWLTDKRPQDLERFWNEAYPEVGTASEKLSVLERNGYTPLGYFPLPKECWMENYYHPVRRKLNSMRVKYNDSEVVPKYVEQELEEIRLYEAHSDYVSYGFYIVKKLTD